MKTDIHPQYHEGVKVTCSCGNSFVVKSTKNDILVEICDKCHPFHTGKKRLIDSMDRRIDKFEAKMEKQKEESKTRSSKRTKHAKRDEIRNKDKEDSQTKSLAELANAQKQIAIERQQKADGLVEKKAKEAKSNTVPEPTEEAETKAEEAKPEVVEEKQPDNK